MNENIPNIDSVEDITDKFWEQRFEQINNFEKHIAENGTIIFKFFLNISKDEQKYRLLRRLNRPDKQWKFSSGDLKERKLWDKYQTCYEDAINKTSKSNAPWYVIPSDDKSTARLIVTEVLLNHLKSFTDIKEPELPDDEKAKIEDYKKALENELLKHKSNADTLSSELENLKKIGIDKEKKIFETKKYLNEKVDKFVKPMIVYLMK